MKLLSVLFQYLNVTPKPLPSADGRPKVLESNNEFEKKNYYRRDMFGSIAAEQIFLGDISLIFIKISTYFYFLCEYVNAWEIIDNIICHGTVFTK